MHDNTPLLMHWQVTSCLQNVEVLLRERLVVERVIRSIFCIMRLGSGGLKPLEFGKDSLAISIRIVAFVMMRKIWVRGRVDVGRLDSFGARHLWIFWTTVSHCIC
jgi:hypothetical protein